MTFSCYHRLAYFGSTSARELFERSLETIRKRYSLFVTGYVVMPEHVHLLVSEPLIETLAKALQALKLSWRFSARARPVQQVPVGEHGTHAERFIAHPEVILVLVGGLLPQWRQLAHSAIGPTLRGFSE